MFTFACILQTKRKRDTGHRVDDVSGFSEPEAEKTRFCPYARSASARFTYFKRRKCPRNSGRPVHHSTPQISSFDRIRRAQSGRSVTALNVKISVATTRRVTVLTPGYRRRCNGAV